VLAPGLFDSPRPLPNTACRGESWRELRRGDQGFRILLASRTERAGDFEILIHFDLAGDEERREGSVVMAMRVAIVVVVLVLVVLARDEAATERAMATGIACENETDSSLQDGRISCGASVVRRRW
jgi:hypothetical protein